jgi:3-deoxy-D-manno-octulosonate 8-phosphate phosphatase (KDO 8-P phosphatase)
MNLSVEDRARRIKVLIFDVDGVLTDGQLYFLPQSSSNGKEYGLEFKGFSAHDGLGITLARLGGLRVGIITKRESATVAIRARDLKLEFVYQGQAYKMEAVKDILRRADVKLDELAYVGDDVVDLPVMRACGLSIATADARPQAKAAAHYVTPNTGGHGAGRDAIDFILAAQGKLESSIEAFLDSENPAAAAADIGTGKDLAKPLMSTNR